MDKLRHSSDFIWFLHKSVELKASSSLLIRKLDKPHKLSYIDGGVWPGKSVEFRITFGVQRT